MTRDVENTATQEYALRHAKSLANELHILISDPAIGTQQYGLSEFGRTQVRASLLAERQKGFGTERPVVFICSPFKRTIETAEEARSIVGGFIVVDERLRERWMGDYDGQSDETLHEYIWPADAVGDRTMYDAHGVESPESVAERVLAVFADAREAFPGYDIVYVSHGDAIQIGLTAEKQLNAGSHRDLSHMENAELRRFN